jgi:hypothetical protein
MRVPSFDIVAPAAEQPRGAIWADRVVALAYASVVSVAMLGWLYALSLALSSGLSWLLS